jgi:2-C-methyl-D-erythritol 4-phosphate cytidylyltransferase
MPPHFSAIILMGGIGKRVATSLPKQFHLLGERAIYQHTLATFQNSNLFQEIILVSHIDWISKVQEKVAMFPEVKVVCGGNTRQTSCAKGLQACSSSCEYVMIHDAVRPFVSVEILRKNVEAALKFSAVDTCIPSTDTVVMSKDSQWVDSIPLRNQFYRGQTPQTFSYPLICRAHKETALKEASDDCQLVIDLGIPIALVEGSEENFKITTEWDLKIAKAWVELGLQHTLR